MVLIPTNLPPPIPLPPLPRPSSHSFHPFSRHSSRRSSRSFHPSSRRSSPSSHSSQHSVRQHRGRVVALQMERIHPLNFTDADTPVSDAPADVVEITSSPGLILAAL